MIASTDAPPVVRLEFRRRPRAWRYMATAFYPSPGLARGRAFPDLTARWSDYRASAQDYADFVRLCGATPNRNYLPLLYPHAIGFRLQMALLTHPVFPVPIWRVLQVRNHLLQHRPIDRDAALNFETCVRAHRVLEKGLEVDLHTSVSAGGTLAWESLNTFYARGRFGPPDKGSPLAQAPASGTETVARWHMPAGEGWRFSSLTGDYNGIHLWDRYARWLGFKSAFFHPHRVLGQCLARLPASDDTRPIRFDAWLKGPIYHDSHVHLRVAHEAEGTAFALFAGDETRPGILGCLRHARAGSRLTDATANMQAA